MLPEVFRINILMILSLRGPFLVHFGPQLIELSTKIINAYDDLCLILHCDIPSLNTIITLVFYLVDVGRTVDVVQLSQESQPFITTEVAVHVKARGELHQRSLLVLICNVFFQILNYGDPQCLSFSTLVSVLALLPGWCV